MTSRFPTPCPVRAPDCSTWAEPCTCNKAEGHDGNHACNCGRRWLDSDTVVGRYLLVARKDGSSSSRRQHTFASPQGRARAVQRWMEHGFTSFWAADNDGELVLLDAASSASRQHYIDTGQYLPAVTEPRVAAPGTGHPNGAGGTRDAVPADSVTAQAPPPAAT